MIINLTNTEDLSYTIEHPSADGSLPFMDVIIHQGKPTSVLRQPTHTIQNATIPVPLPLLKTV